jgi:hypothetical protein
LGYNTIFVTISLYNRYHFVIIHTHIQHLGFNCLCCMGIGDLLFRDELKSLKLYTAKTLICRRDALPRNFNKKLLTNVHKFYTIAINGFIIKLSWLGTILPTRLPQF